MLICSAINRLLLVVTYFKNQLRLIPTGALSLKLEFTLMRSSIKRATALLFTGILSTELKCLEKALLLG